MIFNPLEFRGVPIISRPRPGEPLGWFGWQGIVPAKVTTMGGDIVDMTVNELIDVKKVFGRVDERIIARQLVENGLLNSLVTAAEKTETLHPAIIREAKYSLETGEMTLVSDLLTAKASSVVRKAIRKIKREPLKYCPLKKSVVADLSQNRNLICELFQRCGRDELRFIVDVGLWGGAALGLIQMMAWLVWNPKWSLAAGGALVGYVTDWVALKVMFEPVEPWKGPIWLQTAVDRVSATNWGGFQGLFLTRQKEVSIEFSEFMSQKILSPQKLWKAILDPPLVDGEEESAERRAVHELLAHSIRSEAGPLILGGPEGLDRLVSELRMQLLNNVPATYPHVAERLQLEAELCEAMKGLSSARFERVLHPIFEADELTLILIGGALGGLAGYGQTFFY
mmetsp:Transcript_26832/g.41950  ORF Transcript_26832/g.41950 Transcript_26832/m.41950 type:complete len:396 (-) Transcript_26832:233-1420(-)